MVRRCHRGSASNRNALCAGSCRRLGHRRDRAHCGLAVAGWCGVVGNHPHRRNGGAVLHRPRHRGGFCHRCGKFLSSHPHRLASRGDSDPIDTTQETHLTGGSTGLSAAPPLHDEVRIVSLLFFFGQPPLIVFSDVVRTRSVIVRAVGSRSWATLAHGCRYPWGKPP